MRAKATLETHLHCCLWLAAAILPATLIAQPPPQSRLPVGFPGGTPVGAPTPKTPPVQHPSSPKPSAAIPATPPASQLPSMPVAPVAQLVPPTPANSPAEHAYVRYANGRVTVQAGNSSLNQILRSIMRLTGLQITGGVQEDRVYGTYGPSHLGPLLTNLLAGTGSNVIFVPANATEPARLILSPRNGGAMPPPPSASANAALDAEPAAQPPAMADTPLAPASTSVSTAPPPVPASGPTTVINVPVPAATPAAATPAVTPAAEPVPAKPRTPEEIVQEIMRRRTAQAQFDQQKKNAPAPSDAPQAQPSTPK
jgi:hypothetical protein